MAQINITVSGTAPEIEAKQKALTNLAKLDTDSLAKLSKLSNNKTALNYLKNPPLAVKLALGL